MEEQFLWRLYQMILTDDFDNVDIQEFSPCYLRICGYSNFEIFSRSWGANKTTNFGWMIAKDETESCDETIENIRGLSNFHASKIH